MQNNLVLKKSNAIRFTLMSLHLKMLDKRSINYYLLNSSNEDNLFVQNLTI